jgi:hypothetical protein
MDKEDTSPLSYFNQILGSPVCKGESIESLFDFFCFHNIYIVTSGITGRIGRYIGYNVLHLNKSAEFYLHSYYGPLRGHLEICSCETVYCVLRCHKKLLL